MSEAESSAGPTSGGAGAAQTSGAVWKNRYLIEKEIGRGGFGVVYLARDQQLLSKPVVIKVRQDDSAHDPYFQKKFQQEIEALARIDHPGVVGVLDVGETPEGKPFLVMQYVEGVTLRSEINPQGMDFPRVAHILRQVGQALSAAHDKGVYHRDLKPENIMLTRSGETEEYVKLIDFGIAAVRDSQVLAQTQASKVVGTLSYMAPEQAMGKGGAASDIYSLGVIAFEMMTGQRPDVSPQGATVKPRELRPAIPETAQQIILKALSYLPQDRLAKPRDFGDQLSRSLGAEPTITSPLPAMQVPPLVPQPSSSAGLERAYVLFMDIVAYSKLKSDLQSRRITDLVNIVRDTPSYKRAQQSDQIISLPTGDGMALVFFQNPTSPVECATEVSRSLKSFPDIKMRMGIHTGLVYRVADINTNINVAGGGINLAQRVMDCGDAGHILLSKTFADDLGELSDWEPMLYDLGEAEVKHGVKVNVVNFYTGEVGNPALPEKLRKSQEISAALPAPVAAPAASVSHAAQKTVAQSAQPAVQHPAPQPVAQYAAAAGPSKSKAGVLVPVGLAVVVVVAVATFGALKYSPFGGGSASTNPSAPTSESSVGPSGGAPASNVNVPGAIPPSVTPPSPPSASTGSIPPSAPSAPPAVTAGAGTTASKQPTTVGSKPTQTAAAAVSAPQTKQQTLAAPQQAVQTSATAPPAASQPAPSNSDGASVLEARQRMIQLAARAGAVGRTLSSMEQQQSRQGVGLRGDMAAARDSMEYLMEDTQRAVDARDFDTARRNMDLAERAIEKLETFLGR